MLALSNNRYDEENERREESGREKFKAISDYLFTMKTQWGKN